MPWWMMLRSAGLVVVLLFALYCVLLALLPGLRNKPVTWAGGTPMSRLGRFAFGGLLACFALSELVWPRWQSSPPRAMYAVVVVLFVAMFVSAGYDWLASNKDRSREGAEQGDPSDSTSSPASRDSGLDLRYLPWYFWLGLAMEAIGLALALVPRFMAAGADAPAQTNEYGLISGLLVFIVGFGVAILGYMDGKRRAKE